MRKTSGVPSLRAISMNLIHDGMLAKDIADHQLALAVRLAVSTTFSAFATVSAKRLLDEDMGARFHRLDGEIGMGVGQRVDRHDIGLELGQRLVEIRRISWRP